MSKWSSLESWGEDSYALRNGPGWSIEEGIGWSLAICLDDYSLHSYKGYDKVPDDFRDFIDILQTYVET